MLHPSPSMAARQPPGAGASGGMENSINNDLMRIPQSTFSQLKQEAGLADKDLSSLMFAEKVRFCGLFDWDVADGILRSSNDY